MIDQARIELATLASLPRVCGPYSIYPERVDYRIRATC